MFRYPDLRSQPNTAAVDAAPKAIITNAEGKQNAGGKQNPATDLIRGFVFEGANRAPVKESATSLQELGRLAASGTPYQAVPLDLKERMMKDLATRFDSVFVLSPDGKTYQQPFAVRGVPVERIDESSPYWEPGWLSLETLLLEEHEAQEKKRESRAKAEALGIPKTDRKHRLRQAEKIASDDCSKYAKIREIFGNGNGAYHPNQLVAKKYIPAQGLCEKELLYKFALKISNLQELFQKRKLAMNPYDFYRWAICKNLKSDLHNALNNARTSLPGLIRTMGDDGGQADPVFRTIVLYWASLTGNENKFGKHKNKNHSQDKRASEPRKWEVKSRRPKVGLGGRDLASIISCEEMRRRKQERARREAARPKVFGGVNAHRAEKELAAGN